VCSNRAGKADGLVVEMLWMLTNRFTMGFLVRYLRRWLREGTLNVADVNETPTSSSQHRVHYGGVCIVCVCEYEEFGLGTYRSGSMFSRITPDDGRKPSPRNPQNRYQLPPKRLTSLTD
jgi:hypothetical protein